MTQRSRTLEFGIYRDGDNNLDMSQSLTVAQALQSSGNDSAVQYTVEDTTGLRADGDDIAEGRKNSSLGRSTTPKLRARSKPGSTCRRESMFDVDDGLCYALSRAGVKYLAASPDQPPKRAQAVRRR